jgi:hypothetical protein
MQITLAPDSSIASAPAGVGPGLTAAVEAAAAIFEQDFPGNYNVNISYGWGTFDDEPSNVLLTPGDGVFSLGGGTSTAVSYSGSVRQVLQKAVRRIGGFRRLGGVEFSYAP